MTSNHRSTTDFRRERQYRIWFKAIIAIYAMTVFVLMIAVCFTIIALTLSESGLQEMNPFVRNLIQQYGIFPGLLFITLLNLFLIWIWWFLFLIPFFAEKGNNGSAYDKALIYSWISSWGLSEFAVFLLDAINDISWVVFGHSPIVMTGIMDYPILLVLFSSVVLTFLFLTFIYVRRRRTKKQKRQ